MNTINGIGFTDFAFFGYSVTDFMKAKEFYGGILGLRETVCMGEGEDIGWMEYDLAGQTLALTKSFEHWMADPNGGQVCLEVRDLDSAVSYLKAHEVNIVQDIQDYPYCSLALISDPDGNTLTIHQKKANHPELEKTKEPGFNTSQLEAELQSTVSAIKSASTDPLTPRRASRMRRINDYVTYTRTVSDDYYSTAIPK